MGKIKLSIMETSDLHGAILPIQYGTNEVVQLGLAKLATYIKEKQHKEEHILIIDNGDFLQGTPLAGYYVRSMQSSVHPVVLAMNEIRYDAAVIGNHEFNFGLGVLNKAATDADFPFLSCNTLDKQTKTPFFGKPYIVKKFKSGLKAAVLGVTTHYVPNWEKPDHIAGLTFEDAVDSAKKWVHHIRSQEKPDIMIVSYHGGFEIDLTSGREIERKEKGENQAYRMCMEIEGIDVLLTGHQHRKLAGEVNGVTVLQPGYSGEYIGEVTVDVEATDSGFEITEKQACYLQAEGFPADEQLVKLIQPYEQGTQLWLDKIIGYVEGDMEIRDPFEARIKEHPLIELINKVQMQAAGTDISSTALFHNKSPGLPQKVTMRDIVANYIYPNSLMVIEISGAEMKAALERSASYFSLDINGKPVVSREFSYPKPQHYNYDMWEGVNYTIDIAKPLGERIVDLTHKGSAVTEYQLYEVVMNNYRAGGGGDYSMFKGKKVIKEIQTDMVELMAQYIIKHGTIKAEVNRNWDVIFPDHGINNS